MRWESTATLSCGSVRLCKHSNLIIILMYMWRKSVSIVIILCILSDFILPFTEATIKDITFYFCTHVDWFIINTYIFFTFISFLDDHCSHCNNFVKLCWFSSSFIHTFSILLIILPWIKKLCLSILSLFFVHKLWT